MNLRTYFHYLCSLYQQDCIKRKHEIRSKQKSIAYYRRSGVDYSRGQYPQDRDNDMADRFPILAFQDRRGHSRIPSLLFVCFQKALLQAHQTYRRKKKEKNCPFSFFDVKGWIVMVFMITFGITMRSFHILPDAFISVFYTGLSLALMFTGVLFIRYWWINRKGNLFTPPPEE